MPGTKRPRSAGVGADADADSAPQELVLPAGTLVLSPDGERWVAARITLHTAAGTIAAVEVLDEAPDARLASHFLVPGLIDSHVHVTASTADAYAGPRARVCEIMGFDQGVFPLMSQDASTATTSADVKK